MLIDFPIHEPLVRDPIHLDHFALSLERQMAMEGMITASENQQRAECRGNFARLNLRCPQRC